MTPRDLAKSYLRYWSPTPSGGMELADNAPSALWQFAFRTKDSIDRASLYLALRTLATGEPAPAPSIGGTLKWFVAHPDALSHFDEILGSRKPPTTFPELTERAYRAAQQISLDRVRDFIKAEIESYE